VTTIRPEQRCDQVARSRATTQTRMAAMSSSWTWLGQLSSLLQPRTSGVAARDPNPPAARPARARVRELHERSAQSRPQSSSRRPRGRRGFGS
jgi:hypothetical protein